MKPTRREFLKGLVAGTTTFVLGPRVTPTTAAVPEIIKLPPIKLQGYITHVDFLLELAHDSPGVPSQGPVTGKILVLDQNGEVIHEIPERTYPENCTIEISFIPEAEAKKRLRETGHP